MPALLDTTCPKNPSTELGDGPAPPTSWGARAKNYSSYWKRRLAVMAATGLRATSSQTNRLGFGILMYHRVTPHPKGLSKPTWNVTPKKFRSQLEGLLDLGYEPKPLPMMLDYHQNQKPIAANWFVITFDDIYENVYKNAWPILEELKIPATMFLATAYLDSPSPFPFDDWPHSGQHSVANEHWKPVTTEQCREMQSSGLVDLGGHTHTHEDFRGRPDDLYRDLMTCRKELQHRFGIATPTFAFPYGTRHLGFSGPVFSEVAQKAGFECSLTTEDEPVTPDCSPFDWGRFTAEEYDTPLSLAAKLDGYFTKAKGVWQSITSRGVVRPKRAEDGLAPS